MSAASERIKVGKQVSITRVFDAPRDALFRAWTEPERVAQWWGPKEFTNKVRKWEVRPSGAIDLDMVGPDGTAYPMRGTFLAADPPNSFVLTSGAFENDKGEAQLVDVTTVTLAEQDGKTRMTLNAVVTKASPETAEALAGMEQGWNESLGRLAEYLGQATGAATGGYAQQPPEPSVALRRLGVLVGTWKLSGRESGPEGEISGQVTFEWLEGGFFLVQHVDIDHIGHKIRGIEVIGHEKKFGADAPAEDVTSRFYDNEGNTFDYVYELDGVDLTIWGGEVGSPANYKGRINDDHSTITGRWEWPGGGYTASLTRVK